MPIVPGLLQQFEAMGPQTVRARLGDFQHIVLMAAQEWLSQTDREERERGEASRAAEMEVARAAKDAALAANELAREANIIARAASDSAALSATAARTNNMIAIAALVAAIIAIAVSVAGILVKP
jgi:hypothetical protein